MHPRRRRLRALRHLRLPARPHRGHRARARVSRSTSPPTSARWPSRRRAARASRSDDAVVDIYRKAVDALRDANGGDEKAAVRFTGYEREEGEGKVALPRARQGRARTQRRRPPTKGDKVAVVVDETPFYGESGGQVGDRGEIRTQAGARDQRAGHAEAARRPRRAPRRGASRARSPSARRVQLEVDHALRTATRRNHSATHLLHWALRKVVGEQRAAEGLARRARSPALRLLARASRSRRRRSSASRTS